MNEDPVQHAETTIANLTPPEAVEMPLQLEDFHPGESFASYYARQAVKEKRKAVEAERLAVEAERLAVEEKRKADEEKHKILELLQQGKHEEAMQLLSAGLTKTTPGDPT